MNAQNNKKRSIKTLTSLAGVAIASFCLSLPVSAQTPQNDSSTNNGGFTEGPQWDNRGSVSEQQLRNDGTINRQRMDERDTPSTQQLDNRNTPGTQQFNNRNTPGTQQLDTDAVNTEDTGEGGVRGLW